MSHISELIRKQAEAISSKSSALTAAEHLEAAARLLRKQANQPVKLDFKKIAREKVSRIDAFAAKMQAANKARVEKLLATAGWRLMPKESKDGKFVYGAKGKAGLQLRINGNSFTVYQGDDLQQAATELSSLETYLQRNPITPITKSTL